MLWKPKFKKELKIMGGWPNFKKGHRIILKFGYLKNDRKVICEYHPRRGVNYGRKKFYNVGPWSGFSLGAMNDHGEAWKVQYKVGQWW